jgi:hypothetical protein
LCLHFPVFSPFSFYLYVGPYLSFVCFLSSCPFIHFIPIIPSFFFNFFYFLSSFYLFASYSPLLYLHLSFHCLPFTFLLCTAFDFFTFSLFAHFFILLSSILRFFHYLYLLLLSRPFSLFVYLFACVAASRT